MDFTRPYCLFYRSGKAYFATGAIKRHQLLSDVPRPGRLPLISMVPYAQLRERGFPVHDGGECILTLDCSDLREIELDSCTGPEWDALVQADGAMRTCMSDDEFMALVNSIIDDEIKNGAGSNFLLSRRHFVSLRDFTSATANSIFKRFVRNEIGAYLTFCFFDGEHYYIGASPERHITIQSGCVRMNPICGTLPKAELNSKSDLLAFLSDQKEINELFQVVDEELKMMSRICRAGGELRGPFLKEMSTLIHTEYVLEGHTDMNVIDAFRSSMFAATMIGSPLENAARVIHKYERDSRRYYSSAIMFLERDLLGRDALDSAITIRTVEIDLRGECVIQAGASIVRDSVASRECHEIKAKAGVSLRALSSTHPPVTSLKEFYDDAAAECLASRNRQLSRFWMTKQLRAHVLPELEGKRVVVVDNEDDFTHMIKHALEHLGLDVTVKDYDDPELNVDHYDVTVVGPGPGDPTNLADRKIQRVHVLVQQLLNSRARFLAICLGHQILCSRLGFSIVRADPPLQGVQKPIQYFGRTEEVGFYNTFFAMKPANGPSGVQIAAEADGKVTALRAPGFHSFQFHVESVLTTNGLAVLREAVTEVLA